MRLSGPKAALSVNAFGFWLAFVRTYNWPFRQKSASGFMGNLLGAETSSILQRFESSSKATTSLLFSISFLKDVIVWFPVARESGSRALLITILSGYVWSKSEKSLTTLRLNRRRRISEQPFEALLDYLIIAFQLYFARKHLQQKNIRHVHMELLAGRNSKTFPAIVCTVTENSRLHPPKKSFRDGTEYKAGQRGSPTEACHEICFVSDGNW